MTENEVWVGRGGLGTGKRVSAARDTLRATLEDFASTLEQARFRVYRPGAHWTFIGFAREVDGQWCSATVEASDFGNSEGWRWLMKIVPSREDGSSMFLPAVPDGSPLTVETATEVTLPRATNRVLSQPRDNAGWPAHWPVPEAREVHAFSTEDDFALLPLCYQTEGNIVTGGTTMSPIPAEVTCPACRRGMTA